MSVRVATPQRSPAEFLKTVLGRPVVVKLNSGVEYRGVLACLDLRSLATARFDVPPPPAAVPRLQ